MNIQKRLQVPCLNISSRETTFDRIKLMLEAAAVTDIDQVNWKEAFPKLLPVKVRVAHDGNRFYLYYTVTGEQLRAVNTRDFGSVWEDSCVEFFMQREGEKMYRNFECNVLGVMLSRKQEARGEGVSQIDQMPSIFRHGTVSHRYEGDTQVTDWTMYLEIPKQAMGFADHESLAGQRVRANFYKCGDETPEPHFLSWNPIDTPKPDFHLPEFFGLLELE
ncbi:MAG TPA: hypothetical protein GXZ56_10770 [Bacteroidales bacterium]|nr:hypothetical protein [Bacteroidales bacterium]